MAGITIAALVARVLYELSRTEIGGVKRDTIESLIPKGCNLLADGICDDDRRRPLLSKTYTVTLSSGVADLAGAGYADLLLRSLRTARLSHGASPYRLEEAPSADYLELPLDDSYVHYAIEGRTVRFYSAGTSLTGDLTIYGAVYIPSISLDGTTTTLPPELEDDLVTIIRDTILSAAPPAPSAVP